MEKEQIEQFCKSFADNNFGDVMVVGGGISGIQASLDLATTDEEIMSQIDAAVPEEEIIQELSSLRSQLE